MAKYEDYVTNALEDEIQEAADNSQQRADDGYQIPERFKGKSAEEIARAWEEANSLLSRQSGELGELRKTVNTLIERGNSPTEPKPVEPARQPVTVDDLYDDADATLRRVVKEESAGRIEELERKLQEAENATRRTSAMAAFERKHPNYREVMAEPQFLEWIKASPFRVRAAQAADSGDFEAADELFSLYVELKGVKAESSKQSRREAVKAASLERSAGASPAREERYSRAKLENLRIRARQGDLEAERYLTANAEDIRNAYQEGRLTN